ncbi:MAG: hypothetical protein ACTHLT_00650 [Devosia sp.]
MPKKNKPELPKTLRELDPPDPIGEVDPVHSDEFADLYLDVEPKFGATNSETRRYHALVSRVPGRVLGEPDLSAFSPPAKPAAEERWLTVAIASDELDPEARQAAIDRLDTVRRAKRPRLRRGQHERDERLSALRGELVLSVYACAGRTGIAVTDLCRMIPIGEDWWKTHRSIPTAEQRVESRKAGKMAFYKAGGGFQYVEPLKPSEWALRYSVLTHEEARDPPNP